MINNCKIYYETFFDNKLIQRTILLAIITNS